MWEEGNSVVWWTSRQGLLHYTDHKSIFSFFCSSCKSQLCAIAVVFYCLTYVMWDAEFSYWEPKGQQHGDRMIEASFHGNR